MSGIVVESVGSLIRVEDRSVVPIVINVAAGPPGPPSAAASYTHTQASAASTWTVNHNLGVKPHVAVLSVGGVEVEAEVVHVSLNQCVIQFATPYSGSARCI